MKNKKHVFYLYCCTYGFHRYGRLTPSPVRSDIMGCNEHKNRTPDYVIGLYQELELVAKSSNVVSQVRICWQRQLCPWARYFNPHCQSLGKDLKPLVPWLPVYKQLAFLVASLNRLIYLYKIHRSIYIYKYLGRRKNWDLWQILKVQFILFFKFRT